MDKEELRQKYKNLRLGLSTTTVDEKSLEICRNVYRTIDWPAVRSVCLYQPVERLKEVNIKPLVDTVEYKYPKIKIKYLERTKTQPLPKIRFDIIIVPMLAFDKDNNRIGWGGGFYDRFLAKQPQANKIGVCYQSGFVKNGLPAEAHDIKLDKIITEM